VSDHFFAMLSNHPNNKLVEYLSLHQAAEHPLYLAPHMVPAAQLARLLRRARSSDDPSSSSSSSAATQKSAFEKSTLEKSAAQRSAPQISAAAAAEDLNAASDAELARRKREMDLNFTANLLRPGDAGYAYVLFCREGFWGGVDLSVMRPAGFVHAFNSQVLRFVS
jgi:hypothetical protein